MKGIQMEKVHNYAIKSLLSISIAAIFTTVHHVYRLGLGVLPIFLVISLLPIGFLWLFRRHENKVFLLAYALTNALIFFALGFFDGFLDHVFKLLGFQPVTFLAGSDAEIVETVFHLWSEQAGYWFYELTGVIVAISSFIALVYTAKFVIARMDFDRTQQQLQAN
jgi:hypothetical protein